MTAAGMTIGAAFACSCGTVHAVSSMPLVGYQDTVGGVVLELRNCTTSPTTRATAVYEDASKCRGCGRVVTGRHDDPKTCVEDEGVFCADCGRRRIRERRGAAIHGPRAWKMLRDVDALEATP